MEWILTTGGTQAVRWEKTGGKLYLVAPVVMVREQVLNGELLAGEAIRKSVPGWNGRPVVINHPQNWTGTDISANDPHVPCIGRIFHAAYLGKALTAELWLDIEQAMRTDLGRTLAERIEKGIAVEVSTGYYANETIQEAGEHQGEKYASIALDIVPDHLALLPEDVGACSLADGCGIHKSTGCKKTEGRSTVRYRKRDFEERGRVLCRRGIGEKRRINAYRPDMDSEEHYEQEEPDYNVMMATRLRDEIAEYQQEIAELENKREALEAKDSLNRDEEAELMILSEDILQMEDELEDLEWELTQLEEDDEENEDRELSLNRRRGRNRLLGKYLNNIPDKNTREYIVRAVAEERRLRNHCIWNLTTNKKCMFSERELKGMTTCQLKKLSELFEGKIINNTSYAPRGIKKPPQSGWQGRDFVGLGADLFTGNLFL